MLCSSITVMEKTGDVRRTGGSRFSPAKRQIIEPSGLDGVVSEKSKKRKVRRFSVLGRTICSSNSEMGSDGEDEQHPATSITRRLKLPKKFFDDCHSVDHATVPRKLRSVIKKRNRESGSPPLPVSKKLNQRVDGIKLFKKNGMKIIKLNMLQGDLEGSLRQPTVAEITKDEEEVVETLYALAGMFPETDKTDKIVLDGKLSDVKTSTGRETESSTPAFEGPEEEEDAKPICRTVTAEAANEPSSIGGSPHNSVKVHSLIEASQTGLPNSQEFPIELDSYVPQVNVQTKSLFSKAEPKLEKALWDSCIPSVPSELSRWSGLKRPKHDETPTSGRRPEIALGTVTAFRSQHEQQPIVDEGKNNGSTLYPGFSSAWSLGGGAWEPTLKSSAGKLPSWLGNAVPTTKTSPDMEDAVLTGKDSRVATERKMPWKRCSAHVYISRLIEVLQISERRDSLAAQHIQLTTQERSNRGVALAPNNLHRVINDLNASMGGSASDKSPNEIRNAILLHKRLLQDQQQVPTTSGLCNTQKQGSDFLSVSARGCAVEASCSSKRGGNAFEPLTLFLAPDLHSLPQFDTSAPLSLPQNHYSSNYFVDHLSAGASRQGHVPLPCLNDGSLSQLGSTVLPKHQQHQQRICNAQLATEYWPGEVAAAYLPNWLVRKQDSPSQASLIQYAHTILPPPLTKHMYPSWVAFDA